jgi:hypothetical protein
MNKRAYILAAPLTAILSMCAPQCTPEPSKPHSKPACEADVIVVHGDEETDCDLIAGVNTHTIVGTPQQQEDAGCKPDGTECDF